MCLTLAAGNSMLALTFCSPSKSTCGPKARGQALRPPSPMTILCSFRRSKTRFNITRIKGQTPPASAVSTVSEQRARLWLARTAHIVQAYTVVMGRPKEQQQQQQGDRAWTLTNTLLTTERRAQRPWVFLRQRVRDSVTTVQLIECCMELLMLVGLLL